MVAVSFIDIIQMSRESQEISLLNDNYIHYTAIFLGILREILVSHYVSLLACYVA